jgi:UDP-N-acetylmuramate--alanine ligase
LEQYHNVYFIGIGGIGMSALARWFQRQGCFVAGYDRTSSPLTEALQAEGMAIHYEDALDLIPAKVLDEKAATLVVYTPAIPAGHKELGFLRAQAYTVVKRSVALGIISDAYFTIAVAGTHGKTTTSSIIAHLLYEAKVNLSAFLGGITTNYGTNLVMRQAAGKQVIVVEADEYDRSFLTLHPHLAVVTSADADHLDIYGDHQAMQESFRAFIGQIQSEGRLFVQERVADLASAAMVSSVTYGLESGTASAKNLTIEEGAFVFDFEYGTSRISRAKLLVPGFHNVENALAALAIGVHLGISADILRKGLESYRGVKRRFEYVLREPVVFIDDYAHHPTEIEAFLRSVRGLYPSKRVVAVFQPHLFTRTRDFAEGFSQSLSLADEVLLLDIYPAREEPIEGVTSSILMAAMTTPVQLVQKDALIQAVVEAKPEVLVTIGAGDIDRWVEPLAQHLKEKK